MVVRNSFQGTGFYAHVSTAAFSLQGKGALGTCLITQTQMVKATGSSSVPTAVN